MKDEFRLELALEFPSRELAETAFKALKPEIGASHEKRSRTDVKVNKNILSLRVTAGDATALKASANSYLKSIELVSRIALQGGNFDG
ncbi:MAG TPA: hypothetical protein HA252_01635 [Candidatus Diapherotrites archaeon]|uniref:CTAG/PCC1 family protein n=1 Tax=Candidatus Iainarchaeum sp. TaxID=3101447 RepID=A0A7J4JI55_9ARCH|nr:CTAG/PCC1 family protein [Candidatus Diapherotrites archaeon]HIH16085.1 hypothetical protein [Candidatus Diapherotrites archaeon]